MINLFDEKARVDAVAATATEEDSTKPAGRRIQFQLPINNNKKEWK